MGTITGTLLRPLRAVETMLDRLVVGYKWRFGRFRRLRIDAFRGYGTAGALQVKGRVVDDRRVTSAARSRSVWRNLAAMIERMETDEIPGARVRLSYGARTVEVRTDDDGFFDATLRPDALLRPGAVWQEVGAELVAPVPRGGGAVRAACPVLVPPASAAFGVVTDIDDTVVRTGARDRLTMYRVVMLNDAYSRTPFEGVPAFYRALCAGPDGGGANPLFYVSRSAWNLYDFFDEFIALHELPPGPILLRNVGMNAGADGDGDPLGYKLGWIRRLLDTYPGLPFVLIGDSGQHDPEVYRAVVRAYPGRIRAVYIRDVTPDGRDAEVRAIAREVEGLGVPMALVPDTYRAAEHAHRLGLLSEAALTAVRAATQPPGEGQGAPEGGNMPGGGASRDFSAKGGA